MSFEYKNELDFDAYLMAANRGNIDIIKKMISKGLKLYKKYIIDKEETYAVSEIIDLKTLKFFEENDMSKKVFNKCIKKIVKSTMLTHDIEFLSYLIDKYKIDITKFIYEYSNKKYTLFDETKSLLERMENAEKRKREMTFFIDEVFSDKKYSKEIKKAYNRLNELETENRKLREYYKFVKEIFERE